MGNLCCEIMWQSGSLLLLWISRLLLHACHVHCEPLLLHGEELFAWFTELPQGAQVQLNDEEI